MKFSTILTYLRQLKLFKQTDDDQLRRFQMYSKVGLTFSEIQKRLKIREMTALEFCQNHLKMKNRQNISPQNMNQMMLIVDLYLALKKVNANLIRKLQKEGVYPVLLILLGFCVSLVCLFYLYPMFNSMEIMDQPVSLSPYLFILLFVQIFFVIFMIVVMIIIGAIHQSSTYRTLLIERIVSSKRESIIKNVILQYFALHLHYYLSIQESTRTLILFLRRASLTRSTQWISYQIFERLENGISLSECVQNTLSDDDFNLFFDIGLQSNQLSAVLDEYMDLVNEKINERLQRLLKFVKLFGYFYVCLSMVGLFNLVTIPLSLVSAL